jgi:hypothetical protein
MRSDAFTACSAGLWQLCATGLDSAARLDPSGDTAPRVVAARQAIADGLADDEMRAKTGPGDAAVPPK